MERRPLGRTDLEVSILGLGGHLFPAGTQAYYPGYFGRRILEEPSLEVRRSVIEAALAGGINLLAADFDFETEALGRVLSELGIGREVMVTAVVDFRVEPGRPFHWDELERKVDHLLVRLGRDRLDLPQIRVSDRYLEGGLMFDLLARLEELQKKGKIGVPAFYAGDHDLEILPAGLDQGWFPVVMKAFGLLNPQAGIELLPKVIEAGAGFIGFVPFQKGWLFDCGREAGLTAAETARAGLAWALSRAGVTAVLVGVSGIEEIRQNLWAVQNLPAAKPELSDVIARLAGTKAYAGFIESIRAEAPHLALDWREIEAGICAA